MYIIENAIIHYNFLEAALPTFARPRLFLSVACLCRLRNIDTTFLRITSAPLLCYRDGTTLLSHFVTLSESAAVSAEKVKPIVACVEVI